MPSSKPVLKTIQTSTAHIEAHKQYIADTMQELGLAANAGDVLIQLGAEWEFTGIAGEDAALKRLKQFTGNLEGSSKVNVMSDAHMPETAQVKTIDKLFDNPFYKTKPGTRRVAAEPEYSGRLNVFSEEHVKDDGNGIHLVTRSLRAMSGIELASPPRRPVGTAAWLNAIMDKTIHRAKSIGLERIDTAALPHDETFTNSIHLHGGISINGKNPFSSQPEGPAGQPSDLLLCVGVACRDYLRHSTFLFARAESDYARFRTDQIIAPNHLGMFPYKNYTQLGFGMFRGEGRQAQRPGGGRNNVPDAGPLRFELRVPCPGAAGHPNKSAYPEQSAMPYQMVEAYMHILANGVALWKERELARRRGDMVAELTEDSLLPIPGDTFTYPANKHESLVRFTSSPEAKAYWGDRMEGLISLSADLDELNKLDHDPKTAEKGPQVKRVLAR